MAKQEPLVGDRAARVPSALLDKAAELRPRLMVAAPGPRWSGAAVLRLALGWGLSYLEELLDAGAELEGPELGSSGPDGDIGVRVGDLVRWRDGVDDSDGVVLGVGRAGRVHVAWDGGVSTWHAPAEVAEWLALGAVQDSAGRPRREPERSIRYVYLSGDLKEAWGELVCSPLAARTRAAEYLGGQLDDAGGCRYEDEETQETYTADAASLEALGAALLAGRRDVYSLWCARFGG